MAIILCIETATTMCSVALGKDGKLIAHKELNEGYTHAENITVFIQDVITQAKTGISQLDAVAVSKGPGSYTGLRIGVSSAKGLCYALDKPLIAVETLEHFSLSQSRLRTPDLNHPALFCPMLDARRMEVYCAVYDKEGNEVLPVSAKIIDENSFSDLLNENKIIFFGDGASKCKEALSHHDNAHFIDGVYPSAIAMISIAEEKFTKNEFADPAYFEPFYLKDFVGKKLS